MYKYLFLITATLFLSSCSNDSAIDSELKDTTLSNSSKSKTTVEERLTKFEVMMIKSHPTLESAIAGFKDENIMVEELANSQETSDFVRKLVFWDTLVGMNWDELNNIPQTDYQKMNKDIVAESGKSFCVEGRVAQIQVNRTVKPAFTEAVMVVPYEGRVAVIGVKSSGDILPETVARFCGIVAGTRSYTIMGSPAGSLPHLVGMFDLPENK